MNAFHLFMLQKSYQITHSLSEGNIPFLGLKLLFILFPLLGPVSLVLPPYPSSDLTLKELKSEE